MLAKIRPNTLRQAGSYVVLASFLAVVFVFGVGDDIRNRAERLKIDFEDGTASASSAYILVQLERLALTESLNRNA